MRIHLNAIKKRRLRRDTDDARRGENDQNEERTVQTKANTIQQSGGGAGGAARGRRGARRRGESTTLNAHKHVTSVQLSKDSAVSRNPNRTVIAKIPYRRYVAVRNNRYLKKSHTCWHFWGPGAGAEIYEELDLRLSSLMCHGAVRCPVRVLSSVVLFSAS